MFCLFTKLHYYDTFEWWIVKNVTSKIWKMSNHSSILGIFYWIWIQLFHVNYVLLLIESDWKIGGQLYKWLTVSSFLPRTYTVISLFCEFGYLYKKVRGTGNAIWWAASLWAFQCRGCFLGSNPSTATIAECKERFREYQRLCIE